MSTLHVNSAFGDDERRRRLYGGEIFVFTPRPSTLAVVKFAREMLAEAFAPLDPEIAQHELAVERFVEIFAPVKPAFIHNPRTRELLHAMFEDFGCDLAETYIDVPRLRGVTSDAYLTAGVGYAHHPHRDTWYSAPFTQFNWWMPLCTFDSSSALSFHPRYWSQPLMNGSQGFDYYEWNAVGRKDASKHVTVDTRKQPKAEEPVETEPDVRVVCEPGGIVLFSGAQLHSTYPNVTGRTRFSIDVRTVHRGDLEHGIGAPNVDSAPRGTSLRDFLRGSDRSALPEALVARYDTGHETGGGREGVLVFRPEETTGRTA